jgi:hypothetical protein
MRDCLIKTRNCCVSNYDTNIIFLYKHNKIIDVKLSKLKYLFNCLCILPFKIISKFIKYYNYDLIYKIEDLYYTTRLESNHIIPIILNVSINTINNPTKIIPPIITNISTIEQTTKAIILTEQSINTETCIKDNTLTDNSIKDNILTDNSIKDNTLTDNSIKDNIKDNTKAIEKKDTITTSIIENIVQIETTSNKISIAPTATIINTTNDITLQINEAPNISSYDITTKFRLYNSSVPLWVFIKNEDIDINKYNIIKIKYFMNNKIEISNINIKQNMNKLLYELFSNQH